MFKQFKPYLLLLVAAAFAAGFLLRAGYSEDDKQQQEFERAYKIFSLPLPDTMSFAGTPVPLNDTEVRERYDKELLTNVYWQSQTILFIKRANRYLPLIAKILRENNIPEDMKYVAVAESGLQFNALSPAGAASYWQFLDKTGKGYGLEVNEEVDERYHLEKATLAACRYFKEAYARFNDWALVAASYNMGIDGLRRQLDQQLVPSYYDLYLNAETSRYVLRILAIKEIIEHPSRYGFYVAHNHLYQALPTVRVNITQSIPDLAAFARNSGSNYKQLKLLNPWLRKNSLSLAPGRSYVLEFPEAVLRSRQQPRNGLLEQQDLINKDTLK